MGGMSVSADDKIVSKFMKEGFMGHAVRTDRYRYVRQTDKKGELVAEELYDLESDPMETLNLSKEQPDKASELAKLLR